MLVLIRPPALLSFSKRMHLYPMSIRSLATVSDAGPPPIRAIFFPLGFATEGNKSEISSL